MNMSLESLSEKMVEATLEFQRTFRIQNMNQFKLSLSSSTVTAYLDNNVEKRFVVVYLGVKDENDIFYWGDSVEHFSEFTRDMCAQFRHDIKDVDLREITHYALNTSDDAVIEARELEQDGNRYVIDENDALLSRLSVDELLSIIFNQSYLKGMFTVHSGDEGLDYYLGVIQSVS